MKISLNWLKEYVDIEDKTPEELCHLLTMSGSKVEQIEYFGIKVEGVVTGKVTEKNQIEEDSKVSVLTVDIGERILQIVAKIPDIEVGDVVPVALNAAKLKGKTIIETQLYGQKSQGMICHVSDLGLENFDIAWVKPSGLISFPKDVKLNENVNDVLGLGDALIEFEITPNRGDCLSIEGMAIELAATLNKKCNTLHLNNATNLEITDMIDDITVDVKSENCNRYMTTIATNVKITQSDYITQLKLIKSGIRPINNVVDATNYVMIEMGQPMHAFDKRYVDGNKIIVRQAKLSEELETLDGVKHVLTEEVLVVANKLEAMAMAGIMGGELSGVAKDTEELVIESANFNRGNIRITSRRQALRTESSSRFEKGLPIELAKHAMIRIAEILRQYGIIVSNKVIDVIKEETPNELIKLDYEYLNNLLGINLLPEEIDGYLKRLNFVKHLDKIQVPYYRTDVHVMADVAEELARMYGLNNIQSTLPRIDGVYGQKTKKQYLEEKLVNALVNQNMCEIYNYSFVSRTMFEKTGLADEVINMLKITNPLTIDFEYMRTDMVPSMLASLEKNNLKHNLSVTLFENGKIYLKGKCGEIESKMTPATEKKKICIGTYNTGDFYQLKNKIITILTFIGINCDKLKYDKVEEIYYHPGVSAKLMYGEKSLASLGKLSPKILPNYDLSDDTYIAVLDVENIIDVIEGINNKFEELPKFPLVERDLSFTVEQNARDIDIKNTIYDLSEYVKNVVLFDVYEGSQIDVGNKSMSYTVKLQSYEKTLTDEEITQIIQGIIERLEERFNAKIRE